MLTSHDQRYAAHLRVEHWTSAVERAPVVAHAVLGRPLAESLAPSLPYFWSDQCGTKIQLIGRVRAGDQPEVIAGSIASGRFLALYRSGEEVSAAVSFGMARDLMALRPALEAGRTWSQLVAKATS